MTDDRPTPQTALEPIHVVLPMRTVSGGKARLGEVLDAEEREELVLGMLLHTLGVLGEWPVCRRIHVVSPDPVLDAALQERLDAEAAVEVVEEEDAPDEAEALRRVQDMLGATPLEGE